MSDNPELRIDRDNDRSGKVVSVSAAPIVRTLAIGLALTIITATFSVLYSALQNVDRLSIQVQHLSDTVVGMQQEATASATKLSESTNDRLELHAENARMASELVGLQQASAASTAKDTESTNDRLTLHTESLHNVQVTDGIRADVDAAKALAIGTRTESETQFKMVGQAINLNADNEHQRYCALYTFVRKEVCPYQVRFFPQLFDETATPK